MYFERVYPEPKGIEYIVNNFLCQSAGDDKELIINKIQKGEYSLWSIYPFGFMVLSVFVSDITGERMLCVQCCEGMQLYNKEGMALLEQLAKDENCTAILGYAKKDSVVRLLKRIGFKHDGTFNSCDYKSHVHRLKRQVSNGR